MVFPRRAVVAISLLSTACSGTSKTAFSAADALKSLPHDVIMQADLSMLPHVDGRLDDALGAATAVVLGLRRINDDVARTSICACFRRCTSEGAKCPNHLTRTNSSSCER